MKTEYFASCLSNLGIHTIAGVPDSLLSNFCDYLNRDESKQFQHIVCANEGAAVGIGVGSYLADKKPALIYMQNSGIGNTINPIASLTHKDVYDIPMLFLIGWRGEPGKKDEPQHVYQGKVTCKLMEDMQIPYSIIDEHTTNEEIVTLFQEVQRCMNSNSSYAIIVRKGTFASYSSQPYQNAFSMVREKAIETVISHLEKEDMVVSTTGKISREVYEQCDAIHNDHTQAFLTVGAMGHASMIAFGLAMQRRDKEVICMDGDGAVMMHMGSLALLASQRPKNFIHIVLNNGAHESVGGMPTGAPNISYARVAKACGYPNTVCVYDEKELLQAMKQARANQALTMIEVFVKQGSRDDLGRPKETPIQNKENFMNYHKKEK